MEKEYPHVQAAHINALAEEGTREEHIQWLQKQWNEICWLRAQLRATHPPSDVTKSELGNDGKREWDYDEIERVTLRNMADWEHSLSGPSETAAEAYARAHGIDLHPSGNPYAPTPPATKGEEDGQPNAIADPGYVSGGVLGREEPLTPPLDLASLRERLRRMGVWGGDKAALATLAEADRALEQMEIIKAERDFFNTCLTQAFDNNEKHQATIAALQSKLETSEAINRKLEEDRGALEANNRALRALLARCDTALSNPKVAELLPWIDNGLIFELAALK